MTTPPDEPRYVIPYTARPGRAVSLPNTPPLPPRCPCTDSRHHTPGLACGVRLTDAEVELGRGSYPACGPCTVLRSDPHPWQDTTPLDPSIRTEAAQRLYALRTAANLPVPPTLLALAQEPPPMTPETTAAIANATGPVDTHTGPPYVPAPGVVEARREAAGIPAARPVKDLDPESDEAHVLHEQALAETIAELDRADAIGGHGRPQADNVAPANAREAVDEPLPVLLDRLAEATAEASALKAVADQLRPRVEAAAIRRYDEEGTDRYRRDLALVTLRFSADRVVVEDEAALRQLVEADLDTYRAEVTPGRERQLYDDLITVGGALLDNDAGAPTITLPAELAERLVEAVLVHRELDPARALAAVEDELGATVTKAGDVIADTGELVECLRVERGQPAGVQVRCDAELKARALADTRARLGLA